MDIWIVGFQFCLLQIKLRPPLLLYTCVCVGGRGWMLFLSLGNYWGKELLRNRHCTVHIPTIQIPEHLGHAYSHKQWMSVPVPQRPHQHLVFFSLFSYFSGNEVVSQCDCFQYQCPWWLQSPALFNMLSGHFYSPWYEMYTQVILPLSWAVSLHIQGITPLADCKIDNTRSHSIACLSICFILLIGF